MVNFVNGCVALGNKSGKNKPNAPAKVGCINACADCMAPCNVRGMAAQC